MATDRKPEHKKNDTVILSLTSLLTVFGVLAFAVISSLTLGWFASNKETTGNGMAVSMGGGAPIYIYQTDINGDGSIDYLDDIGNDLETPLIFSLVNPLSQYTEEGPGGITVTVSKVSPGTSGTITFTAECRGAQSLHFSLDIFGYSDGGQPVSVSDMQFDAAHCADFVLTHIAVFTQKDAQTGEYSNWINPYEGFTVDLTEGKADVTLYWHWINLYTDTTLDSTSGIIKSEARTQITDHMNISNTDGNNNRDKWFFYNEWESGESLTQDWISYAYNDADTVIGVEFDKKKICLGITVVNE